MEVAKREREVAAKELRDVIRQAEKYRNSPNPSSRIMKQRIAKVDDKENILRDCHYRYLEKAKIDLYDAAAETYLTELTDMALDCVDLCNTLIEEGEENIDSTENVGNTENERTERAKLCKRVKREIAVDENFANDLVDKLKQLMVEPIVDAEETIGTMKVHNQKLNETVESLNSSWKSLVAVVDSENEEGETQNIHEKRVKFQEIQTKAAKLIEKHKPDTNESASVTSDATRSGRSLTSTSQKNDLVRPERISNPVFSGDVRDYARFKKDFNKIVVPYHSDESHQVYIIKEKCLKGKAKTMIINLESMDAIWKRLDDKYGDKIDLVDIVIKDLENLPQLKANDDVKFVQMIDTLEKGLNDLQAIGARSEIANAYTVKLIELKISRQLYLTWLKEEETGSGELDLASEDTMSNSNRFELMFDFLTYAREE